MYVRFSNYPINFVENNVVSEPNYNKYSLDELYDALNHIDKDYFPERVELIQAEIEKRKMPNGRTRQVIRFGLRDEKQADSKKTRKKSFSDSYDKRTVIWSYAIFGSLLTVAFIFWYYQWSRLAGLFLILEAGLFNFVFKDDMIAFHYRSSFYKGAALYSAQDIKYQTKYGGGYEQVKSEMLDLIALRMTIANFALLILGILLLLKGDF